jgi:hypothetical protein
MYLDLPIFLWARVQLCIACLSLADIAHYDMLLLSQQSYDLAVVASELVVPYALVAKGNL